MTESEPFRVYFACVGNSGRSQMAEAFARWMGGQAVVCASGGTQPAGFVLDHVQTAMAEVGISMLGHESTPIDEAFVEDASLVVTMGCGADACPAFAKSRVEDWPIEDPAGKPLSKVREIRDEVAGRVRRLLSKELARDLQKSWAVEDPR